MFPHTDSKLLLQAKQIKQDLIKDGIFNMGHKLNTPITDVISSTSKLIQLGHEAFCKEYGDTTILHNKLANVPRLHESFKFIKNVYLTDMVNRNVLKIYQADNIVIGQMSVYNIETEDTHVVTYVQKNKLLSSMRAFRVGKDKPRKVKPFISKEIKEEIDKLEKFYSLKDEFLKHDISPQQNIILYGEPGNGKSLICNYISKRFSSFTRGVLNQNNLQAFLSKGNLPAHNLLILDDIDIQALSQNETIYKSFLSEIDGVIKNNMPRIIIITTNSIDNLDDSFLRPGRFQQLIYLPKPPIEDRRGFITSWKVKFDTETLVNYTEGMSYAEMDYIRTQIILAQLQNETYTLPKRNDRGSTASRIGFC